MPHYKSKDLIGKTVSNADGLLIGELQDVILDTDTWSISDIQVKVEKQTAKELGMKTPFFGSLLILLDVVYIKSVSDQVILGMGRDELKPYVEERERAEREAEKAEKAAEKAAAKAAKK
jgi:sporulation protein YlmC with PRC-barrel domain